MILRKRAILVGVKAILEIHAAARLIACLSLILAAWLLSACSAVELHQRMASQTAAASALAEATEDPAADAQAALVAYQATTGAQLQRATVSAATLIALETAASSTPIATVRPDFDISAADTTVYGAVPIDSDKLNIIAALAFDAAGRLLAATRAGEVYRLSDRDGDGLADETALIFADEGEALGQVSGMFARGASLMLMHGGALSQLRDADGDGRYETVTLLSEELPAGQNALRASNSSAQAPDGRFFTADLDTGEILQVLLRE